MWNAYRCDSQGRGGVPVTLRSSPLLLRPFATPRKSPGPRRHPASRRRPAEARRWARPLYPGHASIWLPVYADMPDNVEVMHDRRLAGLEEFLQARRGYYNTIWICRMHNLDRVKPILERCSRHRRAGQCPDRDGHGGDRGTARVARRKMLGEAAGFDLQGAIRTEFANAWFCQSLVAVSETEAGHLRALGFPDVAVLGHVMAPNGLQWFTANVLPRVEAELGCDTRLTVAGYVGQDVDLSSWPSIRGSRCAVR